MFNKMLLQALEAVLQRGEAPLKWWVPEQWLQAELFAELTRRLPGEWEVLPTEPPYFTTRPRVTPKGDEVVNVVGAKGGHKWIDLLVRRRDGRAMWWVDLKVRHKRDNAPTKQLASALDAYKHDIGALAGFDPDATAVLWGDPPPIVKAYWMPGLLNRHAGEIPTATHTFAAVYVQLGGGVVGTPGWTEEEIARRAKDWAGDRVAVWPKVLTELRPGIGDTEHDVVLSSWTTGAHPHPQDGGRGLRDDRTQREGEHAAEPPEPRRTREVRGHCRSPSGTIRRCRTFRTDLREMKATAGLVADARFPVEMVLLDGEASATNVRAGA